MESDDDPSSHSRERPSICGSEIFEPNAPEVVSEMLAQFMGVRKQLRSTQPSAAQSDVKAIMSDDEEDDLDDIDDESLEEGDDEEDPAPAPKPSSDVPPSAQLRRATITGKTRLAPGMATNSEAGLALPPRRLTLFQGKGKQAGPSE